MSPSYINCTKHRIPIFHLSVGVPFAGTIRIGNLQRRGRQRKERKKLFGEVKKRQKTTDQPKKNVIVIWVPTYVQEQ